MKHLFNGIFFLVLCIQAQGQMATRVVYDQLENGELKSEAATTLVYQNGVMTLSEPGDKILYFSDFNQAANVTLIKNEGAWYMERTPFDSLSAPEFLPDTATIAGNLCKKAQFMAFSNTLEVWYTEDLVAAGCPYRNYLPTKQALVLKITVNGNSSLIARRIEGVQLDNPIFYPASMAAEVDGPEFESLKIRSRYEVVPVFDHQVVNFDPSLDRPSFETSNNSNVHRLSNGTVVLRKIALPNSPFGYVHAHLICASKGDAYDRTGSVFILPDSDKMTLLSALKDSVNVLPELTDKRGEHYQGISATESYEPAVELMRFFTSFGAGHFNTIRPISMYDWAHRSEYNQEVTALIPHQDSLWIGVFIGNYDKGGHEINLELRFYPPFESESAGRQVLLPLVNTVNVLEMSGQNYGKLFRTDTLQVSFEIPEGWAQGQMLFTTTGHGGWGEGDEFVPRKNTLLIDGKPFFEVTPWRTDCGTYRERNPASGNFSNGLSSSDLSRSNWCPGTCTPPFIIDASSLSRGAHTLSIAVEQGEDAGGSFNHWSVSCVLVGEIGEE